MDTPAHPPACPAGARGYHVTTTRRLPRIRREGLEPRIPRDCPDERAIYCFPSVADMEDGLDHWLADRLPNNSRQVALEDDLTGLRATQTCAWELAVVDPIPASRIVSERLV